MVFCNQICKWKVINLKNILCVIIWWKVIDLGLCALRNWRLHIWEFPEDTKGSYQNPSPLKHREAHFPTWHLLFRWFGLMEPATTPTVRRLWLIHRQNSTSLPDKVLPGHKCNMCTKCFTQSVNNDCSATKSPRYSDKLMTAPAMFNTPHSCTLNTWQNAILIQGSVTQGQIQGREWNGFKTHEEPQWPGFITGRAKPLARLTGRTASLTLVAWTRICLKGEGPGFPPPCKIYDSNIP